MADYDPTDPESVDVGLEWLDPEFADALGRFEADLAANGIQARRVETYRSAARQNWLYAQGRTRPGRVVTRARAGQSWHEAGSAADYVLAVPNGMLEGVLWLQFGKLAEGVGLTWGGEWRHFPDRGHVELSAGRSLAEEIEEREECLADEGR